VIVPEKQNVRTAASRHPSPAHQVNDQDHQRYDQKQVNQAAGHVETEAEKPQNQKQNKDCPKHSDLLRPPWMSIPSSGLPGESLIFVASTLYGAERAG
jgi:hypothetical protein